jgi:hypothetical protein
MEYLMTYGWSILIIAVVLGSLFQLGVFGSSSLSVKGPPGACQVFRPSGPGTNANVNLLGACSGQLPQYVAQILSTSSYLSAGNSNGFNMPIMVTVSAWVKGTTSNYEAIVSRPIAVGSQQNYLLQVMPTGQAQFAITQAGGNTNVYVNGNKNIADGSWHFVVGSANTNTGNMYLYVDGALDNSKSITTNIMLFSTNSLTIGGTYLGTQGFIGAMVADVQLYNTTLASDLVQVLYLEGMGGAPVQLQNLVGWWPLNGDAKDYSGNGNNGAPTGVSYTSQYGR